MSCVALRGFSLRGLGDVKGFPFCSGKKGLRLPFAVGKGSETPSFPRLEHEEGVSDPLSHCKRGNLVHPQIPLAKIPLAQRISIEGSKNPKVGKRGFRSRKTPFPLTPEKGGFANLEPPVCAVLIALQGCPLRLEAPHIIMFRAQCGDSALLRCLRPKSFMRL